MWCQKKQQNSFCIVNFLALQMGDAKMNPSYSSDLHFSVLYYRPNRGTLICSKICSKKLLLAYFFYFWTNLGPILVELIVKHIIRPPCWKSRILEDLLEVFLFSRTLQEKPFKKWKKNKQWFHRRGWQMKGSLGISIFFSFQIQLDDPFLKWLFMI